MRLAAAFVLVAFAAELARAGEPGPTSGGGGAPGVWVGHDFERRPFGWDAWYPKGQTELLGGDWRLVAWERAPHGTYRRRGGATDLAFRNAVTGAAISVETFALTKDDPRDLDGLAERYLSARGNRRGPPSTRLRSSSASTTGSA